MGVWGGLVDEILGDGHASADAEGAWGDFETGDGLGAFEFILDDAFHDPADDFFGEAEVDDLLNGELIFDEGLEDGIEDGVRGERIVVALEGFEFCAGGFGDGGMGDDFLVAIDVVGELIDGGFWDIAEDGEAAAHIAVESAVADGEFAFIARGEEEMVEFIGEGHEGEAADAGLEIFFGGVFWEALEEGVELGFEGIEAGLDGDGFAADVEIFGEEQGIGDTAWGAKLGGHGDAEDIVVAERVGGDGGGHRAIDAAAEAEDSGMEVAFVEVIAGTEGEGEEEFLGIGEWEGRGRRRGSGVEFDDGGIFLEGSELGLDGAIGIDGERAAIEDELIISADGVAVEDGDAVLGGDGLEELDSALGFTGGERGGAEIEESGGALIDEGGDGGGEVEGAREEGIGPEIFADGDAEEGAGDGDWGDVGSGFEVAIFLEDVVIGEARFVDEAEGFSAFEDGGGVVEGLTAVGVGVEAPDDQGDVGDGLVEEEESGVVEGEEALIEEEILWGVAGEGEFWGEDEIGALAGEGVVGFEDAEGIGVEIADGGVELGEADFHEDRGRMGRRLGEKRMGNFLVGEGVGEDGVKEVAIGVEDGGGDESGDEVEEEFLGERAFHRGEEESIKFAVEEGILPEAPLAGVEDIEAEEEIGDGVGEDAGGEAFGAIGDEVEEDTGGDGGWPIWERVFEAEAGGDDGGRFPGERAEGDGVEVVIDEVAEEETAPEDFFDEGDDDDEAEEADGEIEVEGPGWGGVGAAEEIGVKAVEARGSVEPLLWGDPEDEGEDPDGGGEEDAAWWAEGIGGPEAEEEEATDEGLEGDDPVDGVGDDPVGVG